MKTAATLESKEHVAMLTREAGLISKRLGMPDFNSPSFRAHPWKPRRSQCLRLMNGQCGIEDENAEQHDGADGAEGQRPELEPAPEAQAANEAEPKSPKSPTDAGRGSPPKPPSSQSSARSQEAPARGWLAAQN
jgi:hypothetical protein